MMDVRPIRSEDDLSWVLTQIEPYFDHQPAPGTREADRFDVLATLIEAYEQRQHAVPEADPVTVLHFAIESMGRSQSELAELLGSRSRASEILSGKRRLSLEMSRRISRAWRIPLDALLPRIEPSRAARRPNRAVRRGRCGRDR